MKLNYIHTEIVKNILVLIKDKNIPITYTDLTNAFQEFNDIKSVRSIIKYLNDIDTICCELDMPLISSVVISKKDYLPGKTFFNLYEKFHGIKLRDKEDKKKAFQSEFIRVTKYYSEYSCKFNNMMRFNHSSDKEVLVYNRKLNRELYKNDIKSIKKHINLEKNNNIIEIYEELFKKKYNKCFCEICGFDFKKVYGEFGENYIEVHNKYSQINNTRLRDLVLICSNCHSIVHRNLECKFTDIINNINLF